jgi:hypothetical protein
MKTFATVIFFTLSVIGWAAAETPDERLLGRYAPPALDAGISLTLLERNVFLADWWGQEQKQGNILGGWTSGDWRREGNRLILRYVTNDKKSEAIFTIGENAGSIVLKLVREGEFPFVSFFGCEYPKETHHNEMFENALRAICKSGRMGPNQPPLQTPASGTPAADAPVAPPPGAAGR